MDDMTMPIAIGSRVSSTRRFTAADVILFAELSGDRNPVHLDAAFARTTRFGQPLVHGMLVASTISALIAHRLPGPGSIYIEQDLRFVRPVFHEMEITASVEVVAVPKRGIYQLSTRVVDSAGQVLIDGRALVMNRGSS